MMLEEISENLNWDMSGYLSLVDEYGEMPSYDDEVAIDYLVENSPKSEEEIREDIDTMKQKGLVQVKTRFSNSSVQSYDGSFNSLEKEHLQLTEAGKEFLEE